MRVAIVIFALCGCGFASAPSGLRCYTEPCEEEVVCLEDGGCENLVAEIVIDPLSQAANDVPVTQLSSSLDFDLSRQPTIVGEFQRELSTMINPAYRGIYTAPVSVRAVGRSVLIPGRARVYSSSFVNAERGTFSLKVGSGLYLLQATPEDTSVPPEFALDVPAYAHTPESITFAFATIEGAIRLQGRLVRKRLQGPPMMDLPITEAPMDLQVFDPLSRLPLSQRVAVSSGTPSSTGDFATSLSLRASSLSVVTVVVGPRLPGSLVPTKSFALPLPFPSEVLLEMGDFGTPLANVQGQVRAHTGAPIGSARVLVEGIVGGGGEYRSKVATTDESGRFSMDLLAGHDLSLMVVPPPNSPAGTWRGRVAVRMTDAGPQLEPGLITCPPRIIAHGVLVSSERAPAAQVHVRASFISGTGTGLTLDDALTETDSNGTFTLSLDPGEWTLDFQPPTSIDSSGAVITPMWPRQSRRVTVPAITSSALRVLDHDLGRFSLQRGRLVRGTIYSQGKTVPNGTIRFFKVPKVYGGPTGLVQLVGTAATDGQGRYEVVLPVTEPTR